MGRIPPTPRASRSRTAARWLPAPPPVADRTNDGEDTCAGVVRAGERLLVASVERAGSGGATRRDEPDAAAAARRTSRSARPVDQERRRIPGSLHRLARWNQFR